MVTHHCFIHNQCYFYCPTINDMIVSLHTTMTVTYNTIINNTGFLYILCTYLSVVLHCFFRWISVYEYCCHIVPGMWSPLMSLCLSTYCAISCNVINCCVDLQRCCLNWEWYWPILQDCCYGIPLHTCTGWYQLQVREEKLLWKNDHFL